jgi:hypothetical protein
VGGRYAATHGEVETGDMHELSVIEGACRRDRMSGVRVRWIIPLEIRIEKMGVVPVDWYWGESQGMAGRKTRTCCFSAVLGGFTIMKRNQ